MKKIYFSLPVLISDREDFYKERIDEIHYSKGKLSVNVSCRYWREDTTYDPLIVNNSDIFVFRPLRNDFNFSINSLPSGVKKELSKAYILNKSIYMLYRNVAGEWNYYKVEVDGTIVRGIAGSTGQFWQEFTDSHTNIDKEPPTLSQKEDKVVTIHTPFDKRLLL